MDLLDAAIYLGLLLATLFALSVMPGTPHYQTKGNLAKSNRKLKSESITPTSK